MKIIEIASRLLLNHFTLGFLSSHLYKTSHATDVCHLSPLFRQSPFRTVRQKCMLPKRRFWKSEQKLGRAFSNDFQPVVAQSSTQTLAKYLEKARPIFCSDFLNLRLVLGRSIKCKVQTQVEILDDLFEMEIV